LKPLREKFDAQDADEAAASAMLGQVGPLEPSAARKRRVMSAIESRSGMGLRLLRPAVFGGIVLVLATGASAMVGRQWIRSRAALSATDKETVASPAAPRSVAQKVVTSEKAPLPVPPPADVVATPVVEAPKPAPQVVARKPATARVQAPTPETPLLASPQAALMVEAMQARRAGDMVRAGELAAEYERKYPDGVLREEAQVLGIEAAASRGDGEAQRLAEQYLSRFPHGRFRAQAERALKAAR
jgi:hypothetical protein